MRRKSFENVINSTDEVVGATRNNNNNNNRMIDIIVGHHFGEPFVWYFVPNHQKLHPWFDLPFTPRMHRHRFDECRSIKTVLIVPPFERRFHNSCERGDQPACALSQTNKQISIQGTLHRMIQNGSMCVSHQQ
jgi:hypothetical protein